MVYLEDGFLVLDLENALLGEFDKDRQTIKIDPGAIASIYLKRQIYKDQLRIQPKNNDLLEAVPGKHKDELKLKIRNRYRAEAEQLIQDVQRLS